MVSSSDYIVHVTAGPSYDTSTHEEVKVNTSDAVLISSEHVEASIKVRIKNFRGLPKASPSTSPYFKHPKHTSDLYSISFSFTPKTSSPAFSGTTTGDDIIFGNDFDHPIKDRLPPGFSYAFKWVTWFVDPGMFGDAYADEPYIYGPMLSSVNALEIGEKSKEAAKENGDEGRQQEDVIQEGASGDGELVREDYAIPDEAPARQKHFLNQHHRDEFKFEPGREYSCDFYNQYLDFNEFALKLPVVTVPIVGHWDGQPLRYVLKRRYKDKDIKDATLLFVVCVTLLPAEGSGAKTAQQIKEEVHAQEKKEMPSDKKNEEPDTNEDDLD